MRRGWAPSSAESASRRFLLGRSAAASWRIVTLPPHPTERVFSSTSPGTTACRPSGGRAGRSQKAQHPYIGLSSTPTLPMICIPIGAPYITRAQLSSTLNRCNFKSSVDTSGDLHLSLRAGCGGDFQVRVVQRHRLLTPRSDWGLSTRQQRSFATLTSAAFTFSGRNPLALWTGRGGVMQVKRRPCYQPGGTALSA